MRTFTLLFLSSLAGCSSGNGLGPNADLAVSGDLAVASTDLAMPPPGMCDVVAQTCTDATNNKCTLFPATMMGQNDVHQCVPPKGTNMDGQSCTRVTFGDDDCAKGLACTLRGGGPNALTCHKWCHADTDCSTGDKCSGTVAQMFPKDGLCVKPCTPFGGDCTGGTNCSRFFELVGSTMTKPKGIWTCRTVGTAVFGDACMVDTDCGADLICDPQAMVCVPICDDTHLCPMANPDAGADAGASFSCMPVPGIAVGGVCG